MKVLQITNYITPFIGGIGRVSEDVLHFLEEQDVEQALICFNGKPGAGKHNSICHKTTRQKTGRTEIVRCGCIAKLFSQPISLSFPFLLHRLLHSLRPDVVVMHYPNPFAAFFLLRERKDFRLILWWHSDIVKNKFLCRLVRRQNLRLIQSADLIVGATPLHLDQSEFGSYFPVEKRRVVPYTIGQWRVKHQENEQERIQAIRRRYEGKLICLFVGRHVTYKGIEYLVEAARLLDDRFVFLICGSGPLTEELKQSADGVDKIVFLGAVDEDEKYIYMNACDVFCFPSVTKNENFGLAAAEAMYCGKPAVTFHISDSGTACVNLDGVTGIVCPNRDAEAYASALRTLADDPALRKSLGDGAREHILQHYTDEIFENALQTLFSSDEDKQEGRERI